jgi:hypothetical protein
VDDEVGVAVLEDAAEAGEGGGGEAGYADLGLGDGARARHGRGGEVAGIWGLGFSEGNGEEGLGGGKRRLLESVILAHLEPVF